MCFNSLTNVVEDAILRTNLTGGVYMDDDIRAAMIKFIVIPTMYLLGLLVVGAIIEDALEWPDATKWLFVGGGGIIGLIIYFRNSLTGSL